MSSNPRRGVPPAAGAPYSTSYSPNEDVAMSPGKKLFTLVLTAFAFVSSIWVFTELPLEYWTAGTGMYCMVHHALILTIFSNLFFNR